ncbi:MAG: helix-turn-helix transcriptional regulator [Mycobacteriaceae bacterium]
MTKDVSLRRVSTTNMPVAERFGYWEHSISSLLQPVHMQPADGRTADFRAEVVTAAAEGSTIASGVIDPVRSEVTAGHARDQDAHSLLLTLQGVGGLSVEARGGCSEFTNQTLLVQSDDEPTVHTHLSRSSKILLAVSAGELSLPMSTLRPLMFRPLRLDPAMCAMLAGAARTAQHPTPDLDAAGMGAYLHGVAEVLLRTVSGQQPDHRGTVVLRRQQARDVIRARINDPELCTGTVAGALGMSVRRLQQIFEGEASVAQQIRELRIDHARRLLRDPMTESQSIGSIAALCGYGGHAHFSRVFRQATGMTPRDFRC